MKEYRIYCETFVEADSEEEAYEIGYNRIKNEDYSIEVVSRKKSK